MSQFSRTEMLIGKQNMERLRNARVAIFGVGGVGGYVVEALVRSGIGMLDLIDNDTVALSNLNRQIIATHRTLGMYKVDAAKERILDINPEAVVNTYRTFYLPETADQFDFTQYDYVVDAIDTVTGKLMLVEQARRAGVPIICSMGAGNKMEASAFEVADISKTSVCPLAKVMRRELKKRGIHHLKVVYSRETARLPLEEYDTADRDAAAAEDKNQTNKYQVNTDKVNADQIHTEEAPISRTSASSAYSRRAAPGSMAFVPSAAGLIIAGEVVKDLLDPEYFSSR